MESLTIGQVAKRAGVGVETVRFYEREGLISEPPRRASGYRDYPTEVIHRIRFIKRAKKLGFTLKEIAELMSLQLDPHSTCADVREKAHTKVSDIESKIATLERMKRALTDLIAACNTDGPTTECPILGALDKEETNNADC